MATAAIGLVIRAYETDSNEFVEWLVAEPDPAEAIATLRRVFGDDSRLELAGSASAEEIRKRELAPGEAAPRHAIAL